MEATGNDFAPISSLISKIKSTAATPQLSRSDVVSKLEAVISDINSEGEVNDSHRRQLREASKKSSATSKVKQFGISTFRGGDRRIADSLCEMLAGVGIFVVNVGEIENWNRSANSSNWFSDSMEKVDSDLNSMPGLGEFIKSVCDWLSSR